MADWSKVKIFSFFRFFFLLLLISDCAMSTEFNDFSSVPFLTHESTLQHYSTSIQKIKIYVLVWSHNTFEYTQQESTKIVTSDLPGGK